MALPLWTKKDLEHYDSLGYYIVPCADEEEAQKIKTLLKEHKRCAQPGRILNKKNKEFFFVVTKERGAKKGDKPTPLVKENS